MSALTRDLYAVATGLIACQITIDNTDETVGLSPLNLLYESTVYDFIMLAFHFYRTNGMPIFKQLKNIHFPGLKER